MLLVSDPPSSGLSSARQSQHAISAVRPGPRRVDWGDPGCGGDKGL